MPRRLAAVLALVSILSLGCTAEGETPDGRPRTALEPRVPSTPRPWHEDPAPAPDARPYTGYPDAVAVLGHSGSTGRNSDPAHPGYDARDNSWATGSNPEVDSVYTRVAARNPEADGHALPLSTDGGTVDDLGAQARSLLALHPENALVVVQVMDEHLACPPTTSDLDRFEKGLREALAKLDAGLPTSRIFVVGSFGSPTTYVGSLRRADRATLARTGPCAAVDSDGRIARLGLARLEGAVHAYERRLVSGCAAFARCADDGGAFDHAVHRAAYLSSDLDHLSVRGHGAAAEVAWRALRHAGLVPAGR